MFIIKNTLHLDISVMPIGALAATFITVTLISFSWFLAFPLPDPDKDEKKDKQKKKENVAGGIFYNYFIKPIFTTLSVWIICWIFMAFWGFFPDDFWQSSEEKGKLVKCILDQQKEIDAFRKVSSEQDKVIQEQIRKMSIIGHVLKLLKKDYPNTYYFLRKFFKDNSDDIF